MGVMKKLLALVFVLGCAGSKASNGDIPTATIPSVTSTADAPRVQVEYRMETVAFQLRQRGDADETRRLILRRFPGVQIETAVQIDSESVRDEAKQTDPAPDIDDALDELVRWRTVRVPTTLDPNAVLAFVRSLPQVETAYVSFPPIPAQAA